MISLFMPNPDIRHKSPEIKRMLHIKILIFSFYSYCPSLLKFSVFIFWMQRDSAFHSTKEINARCDKHPPDVAMIKLSPVLSDYCE